MDLIDLLHVNNDIMSYSLAFASLAYSVGGLLSEFNFILYFASFGLQRSPNFGAPVPINRTNKQQQQSKIIQADSFSTTSIGKYLSQPIS